MHPAFATATDAVPITFVTRSALEAAVAALPPTAGQFAKASAFTGKPGQYLGRQLQTVPENSVHTIVGCSQVDCTWPTLP